MNVQREKENVRITLMISQLRGKIVSKGEAYVTIDVSGVGYKVFVSGAFLEKLGREQKDEEITVFTYMAVRETALDLYGFIDLAEKDIFELLLSISGIGPKSAIGILSSADAHTIQESAAKEDPAYLSKISGIGKKTAEKIVLGLKDKIAHLDPIDGADATTSDGATAVEALAALGYSEREAREAVKSLKMTGEENPQEIIKEALKILSKKN